jgi:hypothetical protein
LNRYSCKYDKSYALNTVVRWWWHTLEEILQCLFCKLLSKALRSNEAKSDFTSSGMCSVNKGISQARIFFRVASQTE